MSLHIVEKHQNIISKLNLVYQYVVTVLYFSSKETVFSVLSAEQLNYSETKPFIYN